MELSILLKCHHLKQQLSQDSHVQCCFQPCVLMNTTLSMSSPHPVELRAESTPDPQAFYPVGPYNVRCLSSRNSEFLRLNFHTQT